MAKIITEAEFLSEVLQAKEPVVVDFYADWCGPCKALAPVIDEIAQENDDVAVYKVNIDESPGLAQKYRILSIPTLVLFRQGEAVEQLTGLRPKAEIIGRFFTQQPNTKEGVS